MKSEDLQALVRYRMEQAQSTLADARRMAGDQYTSASVINRCYYAMFYAALAVLQTRGKSSAKHSGVLSLFNREFVVPGLLPSDLGRSIHEIFDLRQKSDYQVLAPLDPTVVQKAMNQVERFVQTVQQFLTEQGWL